jgi:thioredoxin 1
MSKCIRTEHNYLVKEKEDLELEKIKAKKIKQMINASKNDRKITTPITITDANFNDATKKHPLIVIDCWAPWCAPCQIVAPVIEELAKEHAGEIIFGKLNVDENPETATRFSIMGIPTLLIIKNGTEADRIVGAAPKLLIQNKLKRYI